MSVYVYDSHLGGWYATIEPVPEEWLYCDSCGDWDDFIGCYESFEDFLAKKADDIAIERGDCGYYLGDVMEWVAPIFRSKMKYKEAFDIVKANRTDEEDDDV